MRDDAPRAARVVEPLLDPVHAIVMRASASTIGYTIVRAIHRYGGSQPPLASGAPRE